MRNDLKSFSRKDEHKADLVCQQPRALKRKNWQDLTVVTMNNIEASAVHPLKPTDTVNRCAVKERNDGSDEARYNHSTST